MRSSINDTITYPSSFYGLDASKDDHGTGIVDPLSFLLKSNPIYSGACIIKAHLSVLASNGDAVSLTSSVNN